MQDYAVEVSPEAQTAFWRYVEKTDSCWLWRGPHNGRYGRIGRRTYAHRMSWVMANGPIPEGKFVLHECDTPLCVRPDHLFLGTNRENILDAKAKGRLATGERHGLKLHPEAVARGARHGSKTQPHRVSKGTGRPSSKLDEAKVRQIRERSRNGASRASLAKEYGVSATVIRKIVSRRSWKHVI